MFDNHECLLHGLSYVPILGKNLSSITMFDELDYWVVESSYDARYRYQSMFYDSNFIGHALVSSIKSRHNYEIYGFEMGHISIMSLVGLIEQGISGDATELQMLKINNGMEFV